MPDGLLLIACGLVIVVSAMWWVPRRMRSIRRRVASRTDPGAFDAMLRSAPYRSARAVTAVVGMLVVFAGVLALAGRL